jgi:hypothetical protein
LQKWQTLAQKTHFALKKHLSSMFPQYKIFLQKYHWGIPLDWTSKIVASKWQNSPPKKKIFGLNLTTLL